MRHPACGRGGWPCRAPFSESSFFEFVVGDKWRGRGVDVHDEAGEDTPAGEEGQPRPRRGASPSASPLPSLQKGEASSSFFEEGIAAFIAPGWSIMSLTDSFFFGAAS